MSTALTFLLVIFVLLTPFGLVAALAAGSYRAGHLRLHRDQFRVAAPLVGPLDRREREVRERFERQPCWPEPGPRGERR